MNGKIVALMALGYLGAHNPAAHAGGWDFDHTGSLFNDWSNALYRELSADAFDETQLWIPDMSDDDGESVDYPFVWNRNSNADNPPDSIARHVFLFGPADATASIHSGNDDSASAISYQHTKMEASGSRETNYRYINAQAWQDSPYERGQGGSVCRQRVAYLCQLRRSGKCELPSVRQHFNPGSRR